MRLFLFRALITLFVLIVGTLLWAGWYVYDKGFTKKWRGYLTEEFRKHGVEVSIHRLTLDPFQGLVAKQVKVMDKKDGERVFAVVNRIVLDINYANLVNGEMFLNAVDLKDAELTFPIDPSDPDTASLEVKRLNARLLFPPHQVYLSQADAEVEGLHVFITGRFLHPDQFRPPKPKPEEHTARRIELFNKIISEIKRIRYEKSPRLEIQFGGDFSKPEDLFIEARLESHGIDYRDWYLDTLRIAAKYQNDAVTIEKIEARDTYGLLNASGSFGTKTKQATLQLQSTLDLKEFLKKINPKLPWNELKFNTPPLLTIRGNASLDQEPTFHLQGRFSVEKFVFQSIPFQEMETDFSWEPSRWYIKNLRLAHRSGEIAADAMQTPDGFRATLRSNIDPTVLRPFTSGNAAKFISEWSFTDSPVITVSASGQKPSVEELSASGNITLGKTSFRGVELRQASSQFSYKNKAVTYENFLVIREEGRGAGTFTYDFGNHEVRLENITTTLVPREAAMWIDPKMVKDVAPYRFKTRPELKIDGKVQFKGGKNTHLVIDLNAPDGMDYTFLKKTLSFPTISGRLLFTDRHLNLSEVNAKLYNGTVKGGADISLIKGSQKYSANIEVDNIDFAALTKLYFNYDDSQGLLNGTYQFSGLGDNARVMQGQGDVTVIRGNVFAIPILGPLSGILNEIVPGMGYNVAENASASFAIKDGIIDTKDFLVEGKGFNMLGYGKLFFIDDKINFAVRINAQGIPGVLLFPVSKLFEYVSDSSLSKPVWRPKRLPKGFFNQ